MIDRERISVVGIDPGSRAGLVCLSVDAERRNDRSAWVWRSALVLTRKHRKGLSDAEQRLIAYDELRQWLADEPDFAVDLVAIERPADALNSWNAQGQRGQATGTAFALGESYGMLVAACRVAGVRRICDYSVTAWMPRVRTGHLSHTQKRETTLVQLLELARSIYGNPYAEPRRDADENILMALGVLTHALTQGAPA